jgi:hypothetical protein
MPNAASITTDREVPVGQVTGPGAVIDMDVREEPLCSSLRPFAMYLRLLFRA